MSLKAIEMQIALPRTQDAGKIQEQIQQRSQIQHDYAAHEVQKEVDKMQHSVVKEEQKSFLKFNEKDGNRDSGTFEQQKKKNQDKKKNTSNSQIHPYKGNLIDYSG